MSKVVILCVEDEAEVRQAVVRDLEVFQDKFRVECVEDATEAWEVIAECEKAGDELGLILADHLLPGTTGVDLMVELANSPQYAMLRKVLLTGQAGHEDTIRAINEGQLSHYIAKPWKPEELQSVIKAQLTDYVIAKGQDLLAYVSILDGSRLLEQVSRRGSDQ